MSFNINAQVILTGPKNIKTVTSQIQQQLQGLNVNVNLTIPKKVQSQLNQLNQGIGKVNASAKNLGTAAKGAGQSLNSVSDSAKRAGGAMQMLGKETALTFKRFAAAGLVTATFFKLTSAIADAIPKALEFQREMVKLQQVTGKTAQEVGKVGDATRSLSRRLGIDANELASVARIFAQAGQTLAQVQDSLKAVARSSLAPTFGTMEQTAEGLIASLNQFNISASQSEQVLGSLNRVSKKFAVESSDLVAAIRRAGGVFAVSAGQMTEPIEALQQFSAIFTAVRSTTRESAETIATGLRTIFTRMQRRGTIEALQSLGVELTDTSGKFVGIYEGFSRISKAIKTMVQAGDSVTLSAITEELGGIRQMGKLVPALQNFAKAEKALMEGRKGAAEGLGPDVAKGLTPLIKQFELLQARFQDFIRTIADSSTFATMSKMALGLANAFLKIGEVLTPLLPMMTALMLKKGVQMGGGFLSGFMGGFGGGPGMGATAGAALGGGKGSQQAASTNLVNKVAQLITTNNSQLTQLQTVNTNLQSMQAVMTDKLQQIILASRGGMGGGGRRGFASGGLVPGSGSGDTVPAMLSPGEFVIRKSSVGSYGAENLDGINKYGSGGMVLWGTDDSQYGGLYARPRAKSAQSTGSVSAVTSKKSGGKEVLAKYGDPTSYLVSQRKETQFEDAMAIGFRVMISHLSEELAGRDKILKEGPIAKSIEDEIGIDDMSGKVFEGVLKNISGSFGQGGTSGSTWDIPSNTITDSDALSSLFGDGTTSLPTGKDYDAKITANRKLRLSVMEKAIKSGQYTEDSIATFGGAYGHYSSKQLASMPKGKKNKQTGLTVQGAAVVKRIDELKAAKKNTANLLNEPGQKDLLTQMKIRIDAQKNEIQKLLPATAIKAAAGGAMTGSDTVPALLTPGEYVINKKSAQSFGYGNLNSINKYAKGGPVAVQKFNVGGGPVNWAQTDWAGAGQQSSSPRKKPKQSSSRKLGEGGALGASGANLQLAIGNLAGGMTGLVSSFGQIKDSGLSFAAALNVATSGAMLFAAANSLGIGSLKTALGGFMGGLKTSVADSAATAKLLGASGAEMTAAGATQAQMTMRGASGDMIGINKGGIKRSGGAGSVKDFIADSPKNTLGLKAGVKSKGFTVQNQKGLEGFKTGMKGAVGSISDKFKGLGKKSGWLGKKFALLGNKISGAGTLISGAAVPLGVLAVAAVAAVAVFFLLKTAGDALVNAFSGLQEKTDSWATAGADGRQISGRKGVTAKQVGGAEFGKALVTVFAALAAATVFLTIAKLALSAAVWTTIAPFALLAVGLIALIAIFNAFAAINIEAARQAEFLAYERLGSAADKAAISLKKLADDQNITSSELAEAARIQAAVAKETVKSAAMTQNVADAEASGLSNLDSQGSAADAETVEANKTWIGAGKMLLVRLGDMANVTRLGGSPEYDEERKAMQAEAQINVGSSAFLTATDASAEKLGDDLGADQFGQNLDRAFKQAIARVDTDFLKGASVDMDSMNKAMVEAGLSTNAMTQALLAERGARMQSDIAKEARKGTLEGKALASGYAAAAQAAQRHGKVLENMTAAEITSMLITDGHTKTVTQNGQQVKVLSDRFRGVIPDIDRMNQKMKEEQVERQRTTFLMTKLETAAQLANTAVDMLTVGFGRMAATMGEAVGILGIQMNNAAKITADASSSVQSYAAQVNVFKNLETSSTADIESATAGTLNQIGVTDSDTVQGVSETVILKKMLPDLIQQATADIADTPDLETPKEIFDSLESTASDMGIDFSKLPPAIIEQLKGSIGGIMKRQGGSVNIEEIFKTMLSTEEFGKLSEAMSKASGAITDSMGKIQDGLNKISETFVSILKQEVAIVQAGIASRQKEVAILKTTTDALAQFEPNKGKKTVAQAEAAQAARQQKIFGAGSTASGWSGATTDIAQQANRVQYETDENLVKRRALAAAGGSVMGLGSSAEDQKAIEDGRAARESGLVDTSTQEAELRANTTALEHEKAALQALLSSTDKLTAVQNELASAAKSRMTARELVQADMNKMAEANQIKDPVKKEQFLEEAFRGRRAFEKFQTGEDMTDKEFQALGAGGLEEGIKIAQADPNVNLDDAGAEEIRRKYFEFLRNNYEAMNTRAGGRNEPVFKGDALEQNLRIADLAATTTTDKEEDLKTDAKEEAQKKADAQKMLDDIGITGMKKGLNDTEAALGVFKDNVAAAGAALEKIFKDIKAITDDAQEIRESAEQGLDSSAVGSRDVASERVRELADRREASAAQAQAAIQRVADNRGGFVQGELDEKGALKAGGVGVDDILDMDNADLMDAGVGTEKEIIEIKKTLTAMKGREGDVTEGGAIAGRQFGVAVTSADIARELLNDAAAAGTITQGQADAGSDPVDGAKVFNALMQNNDLFKKFVTEATTPGSIYVHDIHTEKLQKSMQGDLSSQLTVMKKGEGGQPKGHNKNARIQQSAANVPKSGYQQWVDAMGGQEEVDKLQGVPKGSKHSMYNEDGTKRPRQPFSDPTIEAAYQTTLDQPQNQGGNGSLFQTHKPPSKYTEDPRSPSPDGTTMPSRQGNASTMVGGSAPGAGGAGGNLTELKAMIDTLNRVADGIVISVAMPPIEVILNTAGFTDQMTNIVTKLALDAMSNQLPVIIEDRKTEVLRALGMENA
jgi:hypothetical protein